MTGPAGSGWMVFRDFGFSLGLRAQGQ